MSSKNKSDDLLHNLLALYGNKTFEHGLDLIRRDEFIQSLEESGLCQQGKHYSKVENGYPVLDPKLARDRATDLSHPISTQVLEDLLVKMRKDGFIYPSGTYLYKDTAWEVNLDSKAYKDAKKDSVTLDQLKKLFDKLEGQGLAPRFEELERDKEGNFTFAAHFDRAGLKLQEPLKEGPIVARAVEFLSNAIEPLPSAFNVVLTEASSKIKGEAITHSFCRSLIQDLLAALNTVTPLVRYLFETLRQTVSNNNLRTLDTKSAHRIKETMKTLFSEADLQSYLHPTTLDEELKCLSSSRYCSVSILEQWLWPIWRYIMAAHVVVLTCAEYIDKGGLGDLTSKYLVCLELQELVVSFSLALRSSTKKVVVGYFSKPSEYHAELVREKINGVDGCLLDVLSKHYKKGMVGHERHVEWIFTMIGKSCSANSLSKAIKSDC
ncbi:hypothetical protein F4680DRAFT_444525 [Xylaria scruposa]|nr:hypothetical protein F4680DRAFT_444525 [Xylaria scruposa]